MWRYKQIEEIATRYKQMKVNDPVWTLNACGPVACRHPRYPGIDDGALWYRRPLQPLVLIKSLPYSGEFVPSYTVGNSLESSRRHVDHFWPIRPGVTPGLEDHLVEVLLGIPGTLLTFRRIDVALVWQFQAPRILSSSRLQLGTIFIPSDIQSVCVCVALLRTVLRHVFLVLHFREQFLVSLCFESETIIVPAGIQSVCACVTLKKTILPHVFLCFLSENSLSFSLCIQLGTNSVPSGI